MKFNEISYSRHDENWTTDIFKPGRLDIHESWFREDTVDYWRHHRMYEPVFSILTSSKKNKWLTIGDGRYGLDAIRMHRQDFVNVTASDLNTQLIEASHRVGLIKDYKKINAEKIDLSDESYDYILCKESFHHFPRPYLALYEMLRVAAKAVILIEPQDQFIDLPCYGGLVTKNYEPDDGNFVYSTSRIEMQKVALGMNFPAVAFKNICDLYIKGVEFELAEDRNPFFTQFKDELYRKQILCENGQSKHDLLMTMLFKEIPNDIVLSNLKNMGWDYTELGLNPYAQKNNYEHIELLISDSGSIKIKLSNI